MDLDLYFEPIDEQIIKKDFLIYRNSIGTKIRTYSSDGDFPDMEGIDIALIGVREERACVRNEGTSLAPDYVRKHLYRLFEGPYNMKVADLGNVKRGERLEDTYFAIKTIVSDLIQANIIPIIIGGSQDLTYATYLAYENIGQIINIVSVDYAFDLGKSENEMSSRSYLSRIILHQPNFLFNYTNVGYQTYFVDQEAISLMEKLYFDAYRLGVVRSDMEEVEPIVRNADMLTFDVSAIRQSDAPGNGNASPNGFYGEEACQITRYAGISDKLSCIGFFETNPIFDQHEQTSHLVAQMIWYFLEGFYNRKKDFPLRDKDDFLKYRVSISNHKHEIVFYKSKKSDRWWMEVPFSDEMSKYERHHLVPCSYKDYEAAINEEMPDRWWQFYQKLT
ncbi:MAG: formimidoylglutamase [Bacteroidetes bacterium]|nr:formimidoylglutamase [Bacteroidota bacterium]MBU1717711.1 formimidoylglutamase [Bacteroidota bacterium]